MTDLLFPSLQAMVDCTEFFLTFVAWGIGLSACVWMLGYLVWFVIQFVR